MNWMFRSYDKIGVCIVLLLCSLPLKAASSLEPELNRLLRDTCHNQTGCPTGYTFQVLTPDAQRASLCTAPVLSLPGGNRRWSGNQTIIARCGALRQYIQIRVLATGSWWTVKHSISPGETVPPQALERHDGPLNHVPTDVILDPERIRNRVATRLILPGQPLRDNQLRKEWLVVYGQETDVLLRGAAFTVRTKGRALNNAADNERVRVQTKSGRVISGMAKGAGFIITNLQESL